MCENAPQQNTTIPATRAPTRTLTIVRPQSERNCQMQATRIWGIILRSVRPLTITMSEFHNTVDRRPAQPRQMAQTIALPIMTNTTGRNHLSKNAFIGGPAVSAAVPLEV